MQTYIAHYSSPVHGASAAGVFEFQSESRANTKKNLHDARMKMLETYGKEAVSWVIDSVEIKKETDLRQDGQLALDFREHAPKRVRRTVGRGMSFR